MLRVSLLGNLGADPELRYSQKGTAVSSFRVAVRQVRTTAEGERQETTEWFRVRCMGRLADFSQRLIKGQRVLVVGRLEIGHFQGRDGEPRVGFDVWADEVQNLAARPSGGEADEGEPEPAVVSAGGAQASTNGTGERTAVAARSRTQRAEDLEDLPF
jgi:single-strand DNA-binding protein